MTGNATIVKILDRAADYVSDGWCQGSTRKEVDGKECFCLFGAIVYACEKNQRTYGHVSDIATTHIRKQCGDPKTNLVIYNDTPGRTQQEVVDTLRAVARKLEAE